VGRALEVNLFHLSVSPFLYLCTLEVDSPCMCELHVRHKGQMQLECDWHRDVDATDMFDVTLQSHLVYSTIIRV
jgi:hypothetical protein